MMPLQIFEKHPEADAYRVGGFYSPYALVSQDKRFTEAELAAEYWRAAGSRRPRVYDKTRDIPGVTWEWEHDIMARFATLPHLDA
jgi:hypothetical protein